MVRDIGKDECSVLGVIKDLKVICCDDPPKLPDEILNSAQQIDNENRAKNPNYFDGPKIGVEGVSLKPGISAKLFVSGGDNRRYSHVLASRDLSYDPNADPKESMYTVLGNPRDELYFQKRDPGHVNPFTQGVVLVSDPSGGSTSLDDLPVLITLRGSGVDHGEGLRHHLAGYGDHAKGFETFDFRHWDAVRSTYSELLEEAGLLPTDLMGAPQPFAIVQDPFELQAHYLAITRLSKGELKKSIKSARDWQEHAHFEFVRFGELEEYAESNTFYSHSRPLFKGDLLQNMGDRLQVIRGK